MLSTAAVIGALRVVIQKIVKAVLDLQDSRLKIKSLFEIKLLIFYYPQKPFLYINLSLYSELIPM